MRSFWRRIASLWNGKGAGPTDTASREPLRSWLLKQIAEANLVSEIPSLYPLVFDDEAEISQRALLKCAELLRRTPTDKASWLDSEIRQRLWALSWDSTSNPLDRPDMPASGEARMLCLSHPSGFVRERAVRSMGEDHGPLVLAFLLVRLNDWVEQVRTAAREAVKLRLSPEYMEDWLANLDGLRALESRGRADHRWLVCAAGSLLSAGENRSRIIELLRSGDRHTSRAAWLLLGRWATVEWPLVIKSALASSDATLRLWASRRARSVLDGPCLDEFCVRAHRDPWAAVRREALYTILEHRPEQAGAVLRLFLLDRHRSLREAAVFYLKDREGFDAASFYREQISQAHGNDRVTCTLGLGESGSREDVPLLHDLLIDPHAAVRRGAIRSLSRVDADAQVEQFVRCLTDQAPGVSSEARRALTPRVGSVEPARLVSIARAGPCPHCSANALLLLCRMKPYQSLGPLLAAAADPRPQLREKAVVELQRWVPSIQDLPSRAQIESWRRQLAEPLPALRTQLRARLSEEINRLAIAVDRG